MSHESDFRTPLRLIPNNVIRIGITTSLLAMHFGVIAQESMTSARRVDTAAATATQALEAEFWRCDYRATKYGLLNITDIAVCSQNYEELKKLKFTGDPDALRTWWQRAKPAEHAKLDNATNARAR
jgi:hypothetical protein